MGDTDKARRIWDTADSFARLKAAEAMCFRVLVDIAVGATPNPPNPPETPDSSQPKRERIFTPYGIEINL